MLRVPSPPPTWYGQALPVVIVATALAYFLAQAPLAQIVVPAVALHAVGSWLRDRRAHHDDLRGRT